MKIKRIEFENFRNFKEKGSIDFSTDGKVTIIYGENGAGKTTLHQLIRWIIYGNVSFNKTATDKLYNLDLEKNLSLNSFFSVVGKLDFEHENCNYSIKRQYDYQKTLVDVKELKRTFKIQKQGDKKDWIQLQNPDEFIEQVLPSGLAEYFFFDGERMIADLSVKGQDSADNLKKALYLMLDLSVYDKAAELIGRNDLKTTVLGSLFMQKTALGSTADLVTAGQKMDVAQSHRDVLIKQSEENKRKIKECEERVKAISEQIGRANSQKEYEAQRNNYIDIRNNLLEQTKREYVNFGEEMISSIPKLLIYSAIDKASKTIKSQSEKSKIINGVSKELVDALLEQDVCLCGNPLSDKEKEKIKELYQYLPPKGYDSLYLNFTDMAKRWGKDYNREKFESYIINASNNLMEASKIDKKIKEIEERMKADKQFEKLVIERSQIESKIEELKEKQESCYKELSIVEKAVSKLEKQINELSSDQKNNALLESKISIMATVKKYFEDLLEEKSLLYSNKLQEAIQDLLNKMLTATRTVHVSQDFALRVVDSNDDESKSEGQFATVSFAYIGGIFKILKDEKIINNKEYPLVLDAPFSKLGDNPRQRVIDVIPEYAPQIIIFSKDDLKDSFKDKLGKCYTIHSNQEQNISYVKEEGVYGNNN